MSNTERWRNPMVKYFKVGGLRFLRIGRLQVSWCMVRKVRKVRVAPIEVAGWAD